MTAEAGIAIFKVAFERWIDDPEPRDLAQHIRASLDELKAVVAGTGTAKSRATKAPRRKSPASRRRSD